ncbi:MAG: RNA polymerase sigma factor [Myxococcota bacterium]
MTVIPLRPVGDRRTDEERVRACSTGDASALNELWSEHAPAVWRFLGRLLGKEREIEGLVQASFIEVWRSAPRFRGESSVRVWILGIAHNKARRHLRTRGRRQAFLALLSMFPEPVSRPIDELTHDRSMVARVAELLPSLSPEQRSAFVLVDLEGVSTVDAARLLELRPGTLRRRLFDARQKLRAALEEKP